MTSGRKPAPVRLRILHGNPQKQALPLAEPEGVGDLWAPPAYMDGEQRTQWHYAVEHAPPGVLSGTDRDILAAWCNACVEYARAVVEVRRVGQVVKTKDGNPINNPFLGIMNRQALLMVKLGSELGFSPSSRASLGNRAASETGNGSTARGSPQLAAYLDAKPDQLDS